MNKKNNNHDTKGELIIVANGKWFMQKLMGIILPALTIFLLIFCIILGFTKGWSIEGRNTFLIVFIVSCLMWIIFLPFSRYTHAKIYKNGIVPHIRPFKYALKGLECFIPYEQIKSMDVIDGKYAGEIIREINVAIRVRGKRFPIGISKSDVGGEFYERLKQVARDFQAKGVK